MYFIFILLAFTMLGILMGVGTGLTPGIHVNTLCLIVISMMAIFPDINVLCFATLILAMSITHTFVDFIPSTFLGAPNDDTALSILPAHSLLLEGRGYEVIIITAIGSLGAYIFAATVMIPMIYLIPYIYSKIESVIHIILIIVVLFMILTETTIKTKIAASGVFLVSGIYGTIIMNSSAYTSDTILFPVFTGLFGISTMVLSLKDKMNIPKQQIDTTVNLNKKQVTKGIVTGSSAGMVVGLLPGIGSAQATVMAQATSRKKTDTRELLVAVSAVNTSNAIFCLIALFALGKPRNSAILTISRIMPEFTKTDFFFFVIIIGLVSGLATIIHLTIGKFAAKNITKIPYQTMNISIIILLICLVLLFTGFVGLFVMFVGFCIGIIPPLLGIKRTHSMGVLLFPIILYFSGLNNAFLSLIGL